jgi:hypothetical protein
MKSAMASITKARRAENYQYQIAAFNKECATDECKFNIITKEVEGPDKVPYKVLDTDKMIASNPGASQEMKDRFQTFVVGYNSQKKTVNHLAAIQSCTSYTSRLTAPVPCD